LTWRGGALATKAKQIENETDHLTVSSARVENAHHYGIIGSITYNGNFTLTKDNL
jgi:hypothetical protein